MDKLEKLANRAMKKNPEHSELIRFTLERALMGDDNMKESFINLINRLK